MTLFLRHQIEGVQESLLRLASERSGASIQIDAITAYGMRGLRADGITLERRLGRGATVRASVPSTLIDLNLSELFDGKVQAETITISGARISVERSARTEEGLMGIGESAGTLATLAKLPGRVNGENCALSLTGFGERQALTLENLRFDLASPPDSPTLQGKIEADLFGDPAKHIAVQFRFRSPDDFSLDAQCDEIAWEDLRSYAPADFDLLTEGKLAPLVRVEATPGAPIRITLDAGLEGVNLVGERAHISPVNGRLDTFATYDRRTKRLVIANAKADTDSFGATLSGTVSFAGDTPELDLRLESERLPLDAIIQSFMPAHIAEYGDLTRRVEGPMEVSATFSGPVLSPRIALAGSVQNASLAFIPTDATLPEGTVRLDRVDVKWDSDTRRPTVTAAIHGGALDWKEYAVGATELLGSLKLEGSVVEIGSLTAVIRNQPFILKGTYDLAKREGEASVAGVFQQIEQTPLSDAIRYATLFGSASVNARVRFVGERIAAEADVDATQTGIAYRWWFEKPMGTGANGQVRLTFVPKKEATVEVTGRIAGSELKAALRLAHNGRRWSLHTVHAESDRIDVASIATCVNVNYQVAGGIGSGGWYDWKRTGDGTWEATMGCAVDEIALRAEGAQDRIECRDANLSVKMAQGAASTGDLTLRAKQVKTPPIRGSKWFAPFDRDLEKYPPVDRRWSYHLVIDEIEVPPWTGTAFNGEGFSSLTEIGLESFVATVGAGRVEGAYRSYRAENEYEFEAKWSNVDSDILMEHLNTQKLFKGPMTGRVQYRQDRDDPRSLSGEGEFEITDGEFSADILIDILEQQMEGQTTLLPPSLKFTRLHSEVEFAKDVIKTPTIRIESDVLNLDAKGEFVLDGDMDYEIRVSLDPDTAERIPLLRDSLNIQGHRIAQRNIDLVFRLKGPMKKPVGELAGTPPVRVTLVSGALEAANEALRVIDAPRKILVDLLKIGGGIVGARKAPQNEPSN